MSRRLLHIISLLLLLSACVGKDDERMEPAAPVPAPLTTVPEPVVHDSVGLQSVAFLIADNDIMLLSDVECSIIGDSIVECWMPDYMTDKRLVPRFEFSGEQVRIDGKKALSGQTAFDFRTPLELQVLADTLSKQYVVYVHSFTGLPMMYIATDEGRAVTSKDEYLRAHFKLVENKDVRVAGNVKETDVWIKGRGHSSWTFPKKPYRLKFDKAVSLLGEPGDRSWVLISNYSDKSMLRNSVVFFMGQMSNLTYTPRTHFVELILNGEHKGTYLLSEKLNLSSRRVTFDGEGYLLEIDARAAADDITFKVPHIQHPIVLEDSEPDITSASYAYVSQFLLDADSVLFSDGYTDPRTGWQKYLDMDSFVDWYLINEIARSNDAIFFSSCYMSLSRGGKLRMGPLWDFDIAFGNYNRADNFLPEGFWIKHTPWFRRLLSDPVFMARVKERFDYFYSRKSDIMQYIALSAEALEYSVQENENKWHTLNVRVWPNYKVMGSYPAEVQELKEWLNTRLDWMKSEFDKM